MNHWVLDSAQDKITQNLKSAQEYMLISEIEMGEPEVDSDSIRESVDLLEMAVLDLIPEWRNKDAQISIRKYSAQAFRLLRAARTTAHHDEISEAVFKLKMSCFGILSDLGADAARLLKEEGWQPLPFNSSSWNQRTYASILDAWLRLVRKKGWEDKDAVLERIKDLRESQEKYETAYLQSTSAKSSMPPRAEAWELIALYHLAKAAEILATYMTSGVVDGNFQVKQILDSHFDRAVVACERANLIYLGPLVRLLAATAEQLVSNSIWTVTRGVNTQITQFVNSLVDRDRGKDAIFDVLPPQRRALAERGLLRASPRAVVVSLPTSSGKTLVAQFRILQALNQFDHESGWVAYLVPTRALVNQITRRLRRDFSNLAVVEQVSPALEIDNFESDILSEQDKSRQFRVLVTTPEKLDLMLRQGWEKKIGRPLTLVVVDEAHNIQSKARGLKLEVLLAIINKECRNAQFLLLTPFIQNAKEVAEWLDPEHSEDISLALDWQPNDRVIGLTSPKQAIKIGRSYGYKLDFSTVHTSRETLSMPGELSLTEGNGLIKFGSYSKIASNAGLLAAATAQQLKRRGSVILMHQKPQLVWGMAKALKIEENRITDTPDEIKLVQEFLAYEFGNDFPLIDLLNYGIGVHHAGLSDEVRVLMEWLFEQGKIPFLAATTTIAQGVNFPISSVVMASHQYPFGQAIPPEDFWNIAGRAGRVDQGSLGVVALVATKDADKGVLKEFIQKNARELNSTLIYLVKQLIESFGEIDLNKSIYENPEWSAFLQYLAHTYRQTKNPERFSFEIEQVLRGTFGFEQLRQENNAWANKLIAAVQSYVSYLAMPGQPLALVDSTGFSLQSVRLALAHAYQEGIKKSSWNADTLFSSTSQDLRKMMGVLLRVPELRDNLAEVTGGHNPDGKKLAEIIKDWVNGKSLNDIAKSHFTKEGRDTEQAITECCKQLFGKISQSASWGLSALMAMTAEKNEGDDSNQLNNLPARVYYGVNTDEAVALRLLGVPRMAAEPLAKTMSIYIGNPLPELRKELAKMDKNLWEKALGNEKGTTYYKVWKIMEGGR